MKYVIDTCVWIEWLYHKEAGSAYASYFKDVGQIIVPTLVQAELFKWIKRERDEETALSVMGVTEQCVVTPLCTGIALSSAQHALEYGLSMADSIIFATAQFCASPLVTCDAHFESLPDVIYFPKK